MSKIAVVFKQNKSENIILLCQYINPLTHKKSVRSLMFRCTLDLLGVNKICVTQFWILTLWILNCKLHQAIGLRSFLKTFGVWTRLHLSLSFLGILLATGRGYFYANAASFLNSLIPPNTTHQLALFLLLEFPKKTPKPSTFTGRWSYLSHTFSLHGA